MLTADQLRCGDSVFHRPSRETWLVAFAEDGYLAWAGWPNGRAELKDCLLVNKATDEDHREAVRQWANSTEDGRHHDGRRGAVLRLYGHCLEKAHG